MSSDRLLTLLDHVAVSAAPCSGLRPALRVLVTGAAGQIAYSLLPMICSGIMLGEDQPVILHLLDIPASQEVLKGVVMELEDCAFPLLVKVVATTDPRVAFKDVNVAMFVGAFPRQKGMERKDLLQKNASIFVAQGKVLNELADPNVKVLVVGNPANTNCLLLMHSAPSIPRKNFSCLTRLDHHRALAQIAIKTGTDVSQVHNVIIWGNHSATQYVDVNHGHITDHPVAGLATPIRSAVNDDAWIRQTFLPAVQKRGAEVIAARKLSSAASAAYASAQHVRSWLLGTAPGEIVSMGVVSDGSYGIPEGLVFSFPVRCVAGNYTIVQGLPIDDFSREQIQITTQELVEERDSALSFA